MPVGESDARAKPRSHFDEVLWKYTNPPLQKKKPKQQAEQQQENVELRTLRKNLTKDIEEDETIFNNMYDPVQGSPRYTKNKRRENEVSKKANTSNVGEEMSTEASGRMKSKRALPQPPPVQGEDENDKNAMRSKIKLPAKADLGQKKKGKQGKSRRGGDAVIVKAESEHEDDLLQEYQQQITPEEQRALKKTHEKKQDETLQEVIVLNNDVKKKKNLKETKGGQRIKLGADDSKPKEDFENDIPEEGKEETLKHLDKKKKKKRKQELIVQDSQTKVDTPPSQAFDDSLVLGVYIHRTDRLKTDHLVSHPMVKVHVVDEITGQYVKKEDSHRRVSSFYEQENVEHVLPIITQPFDFKKQKSTVPEWEEQIIFNERFSYFLQQNNEAPKVILFFEILEFMSMEEARANASADLSEPGFHKIAWAFLKLVGTNGVLNVESKLRLQLYSPPSRARKNPQMLEVFQWWTKYPWNRYISTLYVTVKGLKLPEHVDPSIRSMMALQQERGSTPYTELHTELTQKTFTQLIESKSDAIKWSRLPGQVCRIPNKLMLSFRGGHMGCFALRFSHDGRVLAAACADRDAFPIIVYEIPSGKVLASFNGHLSIVYDLSWTRDDTCLLSASSDGTVRVWNVERLERLAQKILPHPSFVYCAQYHPQSPRLVVTGGYDGLLRVWNLDINDVNGQLLQEFEGHKTFVNALCFDSGGRRMFSADNSGLIIAWSTEVKEGSRHGAAHLWKTEKEIRESDLNGIPINSLEVHPNGRRLLVHTKDSVLRVMDLRIFAIKKYIGATNYRERINSTFTPCGNFIFSGSENGLAYVWNAETGDQVAVYSELCYPTALRGVAFHPHEHLVAFCAFGQNQPIYLYVYDQKVTQLELESMRVLNRSDTAGGKPLKSQTEILAFQDVSSSGMDRFASAARLSLKMQRVKQKLDSVLEPHSNTTGMEYLNEQGCRSQLRWGLCQEGLHTSLPAPSLLSPHANLHLSSSLGAQLIPQATLSSQTFGSTAFGHPIRRMQSLKQKSLPDSEFSLHLETDVEQVQQMVLIISCYDSDVSNEVVTLYDYNANRSDELTLRRGDVIHVLHKDNDNWWFGCLTSGHRGYFPAAYVADEKGFDEELSRAIEAQPGPLEQISEGHARTFIKLAAAVSASGELKIISEQDTDVEAPSVKSIRKKKKVKKSEPSYDFPPTTSADPDSSLSSTRKKRPLPKLQQTNSIAFKSDTINQDQDSDWGDK